MNFSTSSTHSASKPSFYPFGMEMPGRSFTSDSYRFGFNGMEKDDEVKGKGNSSNFGSRSIYDGRLARFISIDPLAQKYPWYSAYIYAGNMPVWAIDNKGEEPIVVNGKVVGYRVEPGQGPTQIADDINNPETQKKYGYCLEKKVNWTEIIYANLKTFKDNSNVSNLLDKHDKNFETMNINPDDVLKICPQNVSAEKEVSNSFEEEANSPITPEGIQAGFAEVGGAFNFAGGAATSEGVAKDQYGGEVIYNNTSGGVGFGGGYSVTFGVINSETNEPFNVNMLEGNYFTFNLQFGPLMYSRGGDFNTGDRQPWRWSGDNYTTNSTFFNKAGYSKFSKLASWKINASYHWGKTTIQHRNEKAEELLNQSGDNANENN